MWYSAERETEGAWERKIKFFILEKGKRQSGGIGGKFKGIWVFLFYVTWAGECNFYSICQIFIGLRSSMCAKLEFQKYYILSRALVVFFSRLISRLSNQRKTRVFSFIRMMWQFFKHSLFPSHCLSWTSLNPNLFFSQNPIIFKLNFCKINFKVCFLKHSFHFCLRLCRN